jgi:hypothetical protein
VHYLREYYTEDQWSYHSSGLFTLHGVDLAPVSKTVELGRKLAEYRAGITARAFQNSMKRLRGGAR